MSETVVEPERITTVVESGETEAVNDLIDELEGLAVDDQLATFEAVYEMLLDCMDCADGYSRQAVVRVVSALDPATGRMVAETAPDQFETIPDEQRFADAIERAATLFVAALTDADGRVRRAAIRGINSLCTGCRLTGDQATIEQLVEDIEALSPDDESEEHVAEARETALSQLH
ncbi:hypothetical protein [Halobacteriaceae bacterium SHR40]|uniref:hypothetical protein n=1 Tax=Halovenus amylolytica TaxID=2500550 RepID=UPI000FE329A4